MGGKNIDMAILSFCLFITQLMEIIKVHFYVNSVAAVLLIFTSPIFNVYHYVESNEIRKSFANLLPARPSSPAAMSYQGP